LRKDGVNCDYIKVVDGKSTAVAFVTYFDDGSREFIYHVDGTPATMIHNVDEINVKVDYFHLMGCSLMFNKDFARNIIQVLQKFYKNNAKISFDPNIRKELLSGKDIRELIEPVLNLTSIFLPGIDELRLITNVTYERKAVEYMFKNYSKLEFIVLKKGKKGATIFTKDKKIDVPPYKIKEIDPTGAGDCFDAAFVCGILEGRTPIEAGKMAAIVGAMNVAAFGPMEGEISKARVEELLDQF